jgi:hypothetical protein|tara:strand:- start:414 stop:647 length:234 start_codon:yes stop_codon:yes gene_type:complete
MLKWLGYPDKAVALMKEMAEDVELYFQRLCINNTDNQLYFYTLILSNVAPKEQQNRTCTLKNHLIYNRKNPSVSENK